MWDGLRVSNNFSALPGQPLSLGETTFAHYIPPLDPGARGEDPTPTSATPLGHPLARLGSQLQRWV